MMTEPTTPSLRDALEAAIESPSPASTTEASAPIADHQSLPDAPQGAEPSIGEPQAGGQDLNALAEGEAAPARQRDEQGRFKARQAAAEAAEAAQDPAQQTQQPEGVQPGPKPGPRVDRAPQAWRPEVREHWAQLPEAVRSEVHRREVEVQRTLQESADARRNYDAVMRTIAPYEGFIRAENSNPLQAIDNLMATAARLRTGTAPELAQMVAGMVSQFGIGRFGNGFIDMLDTALAGQTPKQDPQQAAIEQVLNQRLAPMQQMFSQFQQAQVAQQQRVVQQAQGEVAQFLDRAEFGNDVREDMADLLELAQRRGETMTLQDAYQKACRVNDRVRTVLEGRYKSQGAQAHSQAVQRAKAAAVSVTGSAPAGAMRQDPNDVRGAIEAAIVQTSR